MSDNAKDALGAIIVAVISAVAFVALMGTIIVWGQRTGAKVKSHIGVEGVEGVEIRAASASAPAGGAASFSTAATQTSRHDQVPVLCYHYIRGRTGPLRVLRVLGYVILSLPLLDDSEIWTQSEPAFERQMKYLSEQGFNTITLQELADWREGRGELPPRPVAITFDDGDRSVYDYAWPILEKYDMKATFFVVTDKVGADWEGVDGLRWSELEQLQDSGTFQIESHTHDMHFKVGERHRTEPVFLAADDGKHSFDGFDNWQAAVLRDLFTSRRLIKEHTGHDSRVLAWPFGAGSATVDRLAAEAGFDYVCTMVDETNYRLDRPPADPDTPDWRRVEINRFPISARTSQRDFIAIVEGHAFAPDA